MTLATFLTELGIWLFVFSLAGLVVYRVRNWRR